MTDCLMTERVLSAILLDRERKRVLLNVRYPLFLQRLHQITGYEMTLPMNAGAEAVETAMKLAH